MKRLTGVLLATFFLLSAVSGCAGGKNPASTDSQGNGEKTAADVVINEVMPDNERLTLGNTLDWIELYCREEATVDLSDYALTDDPSKPARLPLSGYTISDGEYLVITLPEDAPFGLSSQGETVYLTYDGQIISSITFPLSDKGKSFSAEGVCEYPTPGQANNYEGYVAYLERMNLPSLGITEVFASGEGDDWVEVRNNSDKPIDLNGYTLTDKRKEPSRYPFPAETLQPGEYFVVCCSGNAALGAQHASFKISSQGETLYLYANGTLCDVLTVPSDLAKGESYGRSGKQFRYFASPTRGSDNGEGYQAAAPQPQASVASGVYEQPFTLTLSASGTVYYTVDGSRPTKESAVYSQPIPIDGVTTVRTFCVDGARVSDVAAYTYAVGVSHDLPIVSVSIPQDCLTGEETGILNHIETTFEYEGQLTLLENGKESFTIPFGFRLHGNDSRKGAKQNFQLRFRSEYGASSLNYPLFENRDFNEYGSLLLKGGSEDWGSAVLRDELATGVVDGTTSLYAQAIKPVVLYLGGEYWGIYYLRERFSDEYVASHSNVSEDSVDLLYSSGGYVQKGSAKDFTALKNYVSSHDMTTEEAYEYLCSQIDAQSLMDWYICRTYFGDRDLANIRRFRSSEGDGKWRWMFFDLDWAFYTKDKPVTWTLNNNGGDAALIRALLKNPKGKDAFLRRYARLMETVLNESYVNARLDELVAQISSEIPKDRERWGKTVTGWEKSVQTVRNYVKDDVRQALIKADLQSYFSLSQEEMKTYFGA